MREADLVDLALALDDELQPDRKRVDHGDADAVQTAGHLVGVLVEFAAGMQLGHDDFGCRDAFPGVNVRRDAAAVVGHGDRSVGIEGDRHEICMTGQRLIDGVVDDFVDHVMKTGTIIGIADVHAWSLADGIQAFQDLDGVCAVFCTRAVFVHGCVGHR